MKVPRDYHQPRGASFQLFVAKSPATDQAHKIGSLFINFGGPGGTAADLFEAQGAGLFPGLNARFDIIAMDPRGVGQSQPSIDCQVNQETDGIYSKPFTTPANLNVGALLTKDARYIAACLRRNRDVLPYVSTAAVARDIDLIRQALGEGQITYFGFSYGTFLGATYASLFPSNYRAMVLDGPIDANAYINDPMSDLRAQSTGFEQALGRFLQACGGNQVACHGFGGTDPAAAYDQLLSRLDASPVPATDGRVVNGDEARAGTALALYNKQSWRFLGHALADLEHGHGDRMQLAADLFYGRNPDGTYQPSNDRYFTIGAVEQHYPRGVTRYLSAGQRSWYEHPHFFWNNGYVELNYGLYPFRSTDIFSGPFRVSASSPTALVVATTFDPATPYPGALNLVHDLGNARLLTMDGDGHTAYGGNSACIDSAVEAYVNDGTLPLSGTRCQQDIGFAATLSKSPRLVPPASVIGIGPHVRPTGALG
ncbi:MAG: alpha/beta hydrolase [Actinomycetota bacterium]|nr:alpha/beta hydrolase [Actinomycetota bacterium]